MDFSAVRGLTRSSQSAKILALVPRYLREFFRILRSTLRTYPDPDRRDGGGSAPTTAKISVLTGI